MTDDSTGLLTNLAQKLRHDPRFMAYSMRVYQQREGLDANGLETKLQTDARMLTRLALCKRPDPASASVLEQVRELSGYTGINEALLTEVLAATGVQNAADVSRTPGWATVSEGKAPVVNARLTEWGRRVRPLVVAACVLIVLLAGVAFFALKPRRIPNEEAVRLAAEQQTQRSNERPQAVSQPNEAEAASPSNQQADNTNRAEPPKRPNQTAAANSVRIALGENRALREGTANGLPGRIKLARALTALAVELQEGSRPGAYEITVVIGASNKEVINQKAASRDGRTLRVNLDLRSLQAQRYYLCIGRPGDVPDCLPMDVISESRKARRR